MLPAATKSKSGKISKSYILTQPYGHVMKVNYYKQPIDVQVWLLYFHPNILQVGGNYIQTDAQRDNPNTNLDTQV